jgi:hypothetical protein
VGANYLVIEGHKTTKTGTYVVGLRVEFEVPHGNARSCVTGPVTTTVPTTSPTSVTSSTVKPPRFPRFTTSTRRNPTTLAKVIETPLEISPNKVILETSLLAAVLAAVLSAGALGSIWSSEAEAGSGGEGVPPAPGDGGAAPAAGGPPDAPAEPPAAPEPPSPPEVAASGGAAPPAASAFSRTRLGGTGGGGT